MLLVLFEFFQHNLPYTLKNFIEILMLRHAVLQWSNSIWGTVFVLWSTVLLYYNKASEFSLDVEIQCCLFLKETKLENQFGSERLILYGSVEFWMILNCCNHVTRTCHHTENGPLKIVRCHFTTVHVQTPSRTSMHVHITSLSFRHHHYSNRMTTFIYIGRII